MVHYEKKTRILASARDVFAWHTAPGTLDKLIPPWERVTIRTRPVSLEPGQIAFIVLHVGPFRLPWIAEHTEFSDRGAEGGEFVDVQQKGPFRRWVHRHIILADGPDTCFLIDRVEYELPLGRLGRALAGRMTYRKIERMFEFRHAVTRADCEGLGRAMSTRGSTGATLADLSLGRSVLVVFLRHAGCTFCREALADLADARDRLASQGVDIALVHMGTDASASTLFGRYGLGDVPRFSDPERHLYKAFGLFHGTVGQLLGPKVVARGVRAAWIERHGLGRPVGDPRQMPGAFVVRDGRIIASFRHRSAGDRPDYSALACPVEPAAEVATSPR